VLTLPALGNAAKTKFHHRTAQPIVRAAIDKCSFRICKSKSGTHSALWQ
jgi:hypothetical protein